MKRFINLVLFEIGKSKFFIWLMVLGFACVQLVAHVIQLWRTNPEEVSKDNPWMLENIAGNSFGLYLSLMGITVFLIFFAVYLWTREWRGKASFIYRLWMIPGNRMQIYFAKLSTVVIVLLLLQLTQVGVVALQMVLTTWRFPQLAEQMNVMEILNNSFIVQFLLPLNGVRYPWMMAFLLTMITILFQVTILEEGLKSYGWRYSIGAVIVYIVICFAVLFGFIYLRLHLVLTEVGYWALAIGIAVIFIVLHWLVNHYLFYRKLSV